MKILTDLLIATVLLWLAVTVFGAPAPVYRTPKPVDVQGHYELRYGLGESLLVLHRSTFRELYLGGHYRGTYSYDPETRVLSFSYDRSTYQSWSVTMADGIGLGDNEHAKIKLVKRK